MTISYTYAQLIERIASWMYDTCCNVSDSKYNAIVNGFKNNDTVDSASISFYWNSSSDNNYTKDYCKYSEYKVNGVVQSSQYSYVLTKDYRGVVPSYTLKVSGSFISKYVISATSIENKLKEYLFQSGVAGHDFDYNQPVTTNNMMQFLQAVIQFCTKHMIYVCSLHTSLKNTYYIEYVEASPGTFSQTAIAHNIVTANIVAKTLDKILDVVKDNLPVKCVQYSATFSR